MASTEHHISKDGSSTLYSKHFNQFYHNPNGAISESRHVFFETSGLIPKLKEAKVPVSIFEVGFGTGLNFMLLLHYVSKLNIETPIHFYSVEAFPANPESVKQFNFHEQLDLDDSNHLLVDIFRNLHSGWNHFENPIANHVQLSVFVGFFDTLEGIDTPIEFFFHDPFSPEVNDELWTPQTFKKLTDFGTDKAILTTYCAASKARAAMAKAGWLVYRAPGALGKREMTVASLDEGKFHQFKRVNENRLIQRFDNGDFDG